MYYRFSPFFTMNIIRSFMYVCVFFYFTMSTVLIYVCASVFSSLFIFLCTDIFFAVSNTIKFWYTRQRLFDFFLFMFRVCVFNVHTYTRQSLYSFTFVTPLSMYIRRSYIHTSISPFRIRRAR